MAFDQLTNEELLTYYGEATSLLEHKRRLFVGASAIDTSYAWLEQSVHVDQVRAEILKRMNKL